MAIFFFLFPFKIWLHTGSTALWKQSCLFLTSQSSEETFCFWPSPHLALFAAYGISSLSLRFYYILLSFKKIFYLKKLLTVSPIPWSGHLTKFSHMSMSSLELLAKNSWASGEFWVWGYDAGILLNEAHPPGATGQLVRLLQSFQSRSCEIHLDSSHSGERLHSIFITECEFSIVWTEGRPAPARKHLLVSD